MQFSGEELTSRFVDSQQRQWCSMPLHDVLRCVPLDWQHEEYDAFELRSQLGGIFDDVCLPWSYRCYAASRC